MILHYFTIRQTLFKKQFVLKKNKFEACNLYMSRGKSNIKIIKGRSRQNFIHRNSKLR